MAWSHAATPSPCCRPVPVTAPQVLQCICKTCSRLLLPDTEKRKWSRCVVLASTQCKHSIQQTCSVLLSLACRFPFQQIACAATSSCRLKTHVICLLMHARTVSLPPPQQVPQPATGARAARDDVPPRERHLQAPAHLPPLRELQRRRQVRPGLAAACLQLPRLDSWANAWLLLPVSRLPVPCLLLYVVITELYYSVHLFFGAPRVHAKVVYVNDPASRPHLHTPSSPYIHTQTHRKAGGALKIVHEVFVKNQEGVDEFEGNLAEAVRMNDGIKPHVGRAADDLHPLRARALLAAIPDDALVSGVGFLTVCVFANCVACVVW